jgi:hypothetical protein
MALARISNYRNWREDRMNAGRTDCSAWPELHVTFDCIRRRRFIPDPGEIQRRLYRPGN